MKLNRMTASFGKLDNATLQLEEGLNIITAPNESGKSTWAGFLKAMLYGIDSRERDKKGYLAEKNRYQPWSGKPMTGQIDLTWGEHDITLRRQPKGTAPFANFSATYTGTDSPVAGLTDGDCGFALLGVERAVYERSAFLGGGHHALTSAPELERRIAALVTTGEEEISYSQVADRLKEWGRIRRVNKSVGLIPKLEGELSQIQTTLTHLGELNLRIADLSQQKTALTAQLTLLDGELEQHRLWENQRKNQKYTAAQQALESAQHQLDALLQQSDRYGNLPTQDRLRHWQGELAVVKSIEKELREGESALQSCQDTMDTAQKLGEDAHFSGLPPEDALGLCQRETSAYEKAADEVAKLRRQPAILTLGAVVTSGAMLGVAYYLGRLGEIYPYAICGVFALTWIGGLIRTSVRKKQLSQQMTAMLERYAIAEISELTPLVQDYIRRQHSLSEAETALRQVKESRRIQRDKMDSIQTRMLEFVQSFSPQVQGLVGCSAAISRALQLGEQLAVAEANFVGAQRLFASVSEEGGGQFRDVDDSAIQPSRPAHQIAAQRGAVGEELRWVEDNLAQLLGRQQASGDPVALAAQQERLEETIGQRTRELTAIQTALTALEAANVKLQQRFSPQINAKAGEYLSYLTQGKYQSLSLNRELEGSATQQGDTLSHSALSLSRGTVDQLYFAVRLAICALCLPQEEAIPLVLDDALTAFDQVRMERALDLLCQIGQERQILLFTCHQRESDYLRGRSGVHCITL